MANLASAYNESSDVSFSRSPERGLARGWLFSKAFFPLLVFAHRRT